MKKIPLCCFIILILFCINYALSILLGFRLLDDLLHINPFINKFHALLIGTCAFVSILIFAKKE